MSKVPPGRHCSPKTRASTSLPLPPPLHAAASASPDIVTNLARTMLDRRYTTLSRGRSVVSNAPTWEVRSVT
jgi:hypothetical protein